MTTLGSGLLGTGNVQVAGQPQGTGASGNSSATDGLRRGPDLPDANFTVLPAAGMFSESVLPGATLTSNRTLTLGTFDTPPIDLEYVVIRRDLTAHTYTVVNGGPGAGTLFTFPASPETPEGARFSWDGTNWNFIGFFYVTGGSFAIPTTPEFLNPLVWLRSDLDLTVVAGHVSQWVDQISGRVYAQATGALRPLLTAASINGFDGIGPYSAGQVLAATTSPFAAGVQRWLVAVCKPSVSGGGAIFATRSAAPVWSVNVQDSLGTDLILYNDDVNHASELNPYAALNGAAHAAEFYSTVGSTIGFVYDGVTKAVQAYPGTTNTVSNDSGGTAASQVGNETTGAFPFVGTIAEIFGGLGTLTASQKFRMRAYLAQRYALVF